MDAKLGHDAATLNALLARQKAAHIREGAPSAEVRIARLDRCINLLIDHRHDIEDALNTDFGSRSREATAFTDVSGSVGPLKHARDNLRKQDYFARFGPEEGLIRLAHDYPNP